MKGGNKMGETSMVPVSLFSEDLIRTCGMSKGENTRHIAVLYTCRVI